MTCAFGFQGLRVYHASVSFAAEAMTEAGGWDARHAVGDHLRRAAEGVVLCLADADAVSSDIRIPSIEAAFGSAAECSACLDIALKKGFVAERVTERLKADLAEIGCMLVGLRRAWQSASVREDSGATYGAPAAKDRHRYRFDHERLDIYASALMIVAWLCETDRSMSIPASLFRGLDTSATSMVLNVAEGNARFSRADRRRFMETSRRSAVKLAARLDVAVAAGLIETGAAAHAQALLARISQMALGVMRTTSSAGGKPMDGPHARIQGGRSGRTVYPTPHSASSRTREATTAVPRKAARKATMKREP